MSPTEKTLALIKQHIHNNLIYVNSIDFAHGKLGICIFLFHYYQKTNKPADYELAYSTLENIHSVLSVNSEQFISKKELCDLGWTFMYLVEYGFIDIESDEILKEVNLLLTREFQYRLISKEDVTSMSLALDYFIKVYTQTRQKINRLSVFEIISFLVDKIYSTNLQDHPYSLNTQNVWECAYQLRLAAQLFELNIVPELAHKLIEYNQLKIKKYYVDESQRSNVSSLMCHLYLLTHYRRYLSEPFYTTMYMDVTKLEIYISQISNLSASERINFALLLAIGRGKYADQESMLTCIDELLQNIHNANMSDKSSRLFSHSGIPNLGIMSGISGYGLALMANNSADWQDLNRYLIPRSIEEKKEDLNLLNG